MKSKLAAVFLMLMSVGFCLTPDEALQRLIEGNERYVKDALLHPDRSSVRRKKMLEGQNPFAIILACSDSRVVPEILFDQGLGDLFIVRVAGNVVSKVELDSIDFAAKYLGSSLILVLGHESCGAVSAVKSGNTKDIPTIAKLIAPAIKGASTLEEAVQSNVRSIVAQLKESKILKKLIAEHKINCIGGYYHLGTGKVEILKDSPDEGAVQVKGNISQNSGDGREPSSLAVESETP